MKLINRLKTFIKNVYKKYPVTYIASMLFSILLIVDISNSKLEGVLLLFIVSLGIISFVIESMNKVKNKKIKYIIDIIISIVIGLSFFTKLPDYDAYYRIIGFIYISLFLIGVYINYKNTKKTFSEYYMSVSYKTLKVSIVYIILSVCLSLIYLIFNLLIVKTDFEILEKIVILIFGFYYLPAIIYSYNKYEKETKFIDILVNKVLFIFVLIAYLIIYIYIIKILVLNKIPSNTIFYILSGLFMVSSVVSVMAKNTEDNVKLIKINNILPYLFIPFIILQSYAVIVRISTYGLTPSRYLGIALIVFEIIYLLFNILKKDLGYLINMVIIELFVILVIPFINVEELSIYTHFNNIKKFHENHLVTDRVYGSYNYLMSENLGSKKIDELLSEEEIEKIESYTPQDSDIEIIDSYTLFSFITIDSIDVSKYSKVIFIDYVDNLDKYDIDLTDYVNECIKNEDDFDEYFSNNNVVEYNEYKLVLSNIEISMSDKSYTLSGYLLKK